MSTIPIDNTIAAQGFAAAGSESRLGVLRVLVRAGHVGLPIGEIQQKLDIPASTLAHHLKFLAAGRLIIQEKQGRMVVNQANYSQIEALAGFLLAECCADADSASRAPNCLTCAE
jgi:DNA-binding transcriptional ArsR family regulator